MSIADTSNVARLLWVQLKLMHAKSEKERQCILIATALPMSMQATDLLYDDEAEVMVSEAEFDTWIEQMGFTGSRAPTQAIEDILFCDETLDF